LIAGTGPVVFDVAFDEIIEVLEMEYMNDLLNLLIYSEVPSTLGSLLSIVLITESLTPRRARPNLTINFAVFPNCPSKKKMSTSDGR
jgi:hypothetical protein